MEDILVATAALLQDIHLDQTLRGSQPRLLTPMAAQSAGTLPPRGLVKRHEAPDTIMKLGQGEHIVSKAIDQLSQALKGGQLRSSLAFILGTNLDVS